MAIPAAGSADVHIRFFVNMGFVGSASGSWLIREKFQEYVRLHGKLSNEFLLEGGKS